MIPPRIEFRILPLSGMRGLCVHGAADFNDLQVISDKGNLIS